MPRVGVMRWAAFIVIIRRYPALSGTIRQYQFIVIIRRYPALSGTIRHYPSLSSLLLRHRYYRQPPIVMVARYPRDLEFNKSRKLVKHSMYI